MPRIEVPTPPLHFIQITGVGNDLFGLTADGSVWHYIPARSVAGQKDRFAFWSRLTSYGRDPRTQEQPDERQKEG